MTATVVLYGRPGCCLCDDARAVLEAVRHRRPFALIERDIETDDALLKAYLERIPVVEIDGQRRSSCSSTRRSSSAGWRPRTAPRAR